MEFKNVIKQFIIDEIIDDGNSTEIIDDESLIDNGILDSIAMLKILDFIEEKFSVKVSDDELMPENFETLESMSSLIKEKVNNLQVN